MGQLAGTPARFTRGGEYHKRRHAGGFAAVPYFAIPYRHRHAHPPPPANDKYAAPRRRQAQRHGRCRFAGMWRGSRRVGAVYRPQRRFAVCIIAAFWQHG